MSRKAPYYIALFFNWRQWDRTFPKSYNTIMFQSLHRRILLAFTLLIILSACLSGWLAWRATAQEFNFFVVEEGRSEAEFMAPYIEATYNYQGSFDQVEEWLSLSTPLGADFFTQVSSDILVIEQTEQGGIFNGLFGVEVTEDHVESHLKEQVEIWANDDTKEGAIAFAYEFDGAPHNEFFVVELIADELGITLEELEETFTNGSLSALATEQGLSDQGLTNAIMLRHAAELQTVAGLLPGEAIITLSDTRLLLDGIFAEHDEGVVLVESNFLERSILGNSRIFITDAIGEIRFDSNDNEREGEQVAADFLQSGIQFADWQSGEVAGYVIVAAGEGYYQFQEQNFLSNLVRSLMMGGAMAALVALVVGSLFAKRIVSPVTALTAAVTRLAEGESTEQLEVRSGDELGQMSGAFNILANSLDTQRKLRSQLVSDVSHELNTPLSIIRLEMEALQDGIQSGEQAAKRVLNEVNLLGNLATDLSMLAETDRGGIQLSFTQIDMKKEAEQAVERWQAEAEAAGLSLRFEREAETTAVAASLIQADATRISQVLGNLIHNAIQHTPAGGEIIVSTRYGPPDPTTSSEWLITSVQDTGEGIASHDLPNVFERFYRVDSSRQRQTGGRGLGLAIVKDIVELHGGRVWVESEETVGSTFYFSLR